MVSKLIDTGKEWHGWHIDYIGPGGGRDCLRMVKVYPSSLLVNGVYTSDENNWYYQLGWHNSNSMLPKSWVFS